MDSLSKNKITYGPQRENPFDYRPFIPWSYFVMLPPRREIGLNMKGFS